MSMQLIRRKSISCLKNQVIFQSEHRDRSDSSPPLVCFNLLFKDPLPPPQQIQGFPQVLRTWGEALHGRGGFSKFD